MKTKQTLRGVILIIAACVALTAFLDHSLAQETNALTNVVTTNTLPTGVGNLPNDTVPTSKEDFWRYGIAFLEVVVVFGIRRAVPKLPGIAIVLITPLLGMALGYGLKALTDANLGWVDTSMAGGFAVWVNQVWRQATEGKTKETPPLPGFVR